MASNSNFKPKCVLPSSAKMVKFFYALLKNVSVLLIAHTNITTHATNVNKTTILAMVNVSLVGRVRSITLPKDSVSATKQTVTF